MSEQYNRDTGLMEVNQIKPELNFEGRLFMILFLPLPTLLLGCSGFDLVARCFHQRRQGEAEHASLLMDILIFIHNMFYHITEINTYL